MLVTAGLVTLALSGSAAAHSWMFGVSVNGKDQGDGRKVYIRSPPNNSPVKDLTSPALACGENGGKAVPKFVKAAGGDTLTFEWFHDNRGDDIIDLSHKGPIITYVAPYSGDSMDGTGPIWSKIAEDGFSGGKWAVERLVAAKGKNDVKLPQLAAGKYMVRQEIIAHHESDATFDKNPARGAQFYPSCVQVEVTGSGTVKPTQNFDVNKGYTYSDPGIHFNLYNSDASTYKIPGPAVLSGAGGGSGGGSGTAPAPTATPTSTPTPGSGSGGSGGGSGSGNGTTPTPTPTPGSGSGGSGGGSNNGGSNPNTGNNGGNQGNKPSTGNQPPNRGGNRGNRKQGNQGNNGNQGNQNTDGCSRQRPRRAVSFTA
ncbi:hypothetical protein MAPG_06948 [Magnaporthiopsis poae ATCC 64411]|uniref:lytic cellulose monooxygenase (C4-dehydrogenating) n=1 Tax=Magnaporthiopsis poae (strain ATCC 64411 / 73-15) TaxID=644358 RepID=A0A0C4E3E9_MAGP6|nr:hypothetical protein MAPG_06948 [Magnaporthiopsis poae ATCC 64411]